MEAELEEILKKYHDLILKLPKINPDYPLQTAKTLHSIVVIPPVGSIVDWLRKNERHKVQTCIITLSSMCIANHLFINHLQKEFGSNEAMYALRLCGILLFIKARIELEVYYGMYSDESDALKNVLRIIPYAHGLIVAADLLLLIDSRYRKSSVLLGSVYAEYFRGHQMIGIYKTVIETQEKSLKSKMGLVFYLTRCAMAVIDQRSSRFILPRQWRVSPHDPIGGMRRIIDDMPPPAQLIIKGKKEITSSDFTKVIEMLHDEIAICIPNYRKALMSPEPRNKMEDMKVEQIKYHTYDVKEILNPFIDKNKALEEKGIVFIEKTSIEGDSHYVRVMDTKDEGTKKRTMEFLKNEMDAGGEVQSECDIDDGGSIIPRLPLGYWSVVLKGFSFVPKVSKNLKILVIGLGGGIVPNHIHNEIKPSFLEKGVNITIDIVEYDETVIEAYKRFFTNVPLFLERLDLSSVEPPPFGRPFTNDNGDFKIHLGNGVEYVKLISEHVKAIDMRYDMIFVDAFIGDGNLKVFMEDDFFGNAQTALTDDGVLIYNSHLSKYKTVQTGMRRTNLHTSTDYTRDESNAIVIGRKRFEVEENLGSYLPDNTKKAIKESVSEKVTTRERNKRKRQDSIVDYEMVD